MSKFAINIVACNFVEAVNEGMNEEIREKCKSYITTGYQQMLWTRIDDGDMKGAFSILNLSTEIYVTQKGSKLQSNQTSVEPKDSIFLTAFMLKCFGLARNWTVINENHVNGAIRFLLGQQLSNGSFPQHGIDEVAKFEGDSLYGQELSFFVTTAILENRNASLTINLEIDDSFEEYSNYYIKALMNSHEYDFPFGFSWNFLFLLDESDSGNSMFVHSHEWKTITYAKRIERVSYVLLALLKYNVPLTPHNVEKAIFSTIQFLVSNIRQKGFFSTTDTVIVLQSLTNAAKHFYSRGSEVNVTSMTEKIKYNLNPSNTKRRFQPRLKSGEETYNLTFSGKGIAAVEIETSYAYNVGHVKERNYFMLDISLDPNVTDSVLILTICFTYVGKGGFSEYLSRMILQLPAGYEYDTDFEIHSSGIINVRRIRKSKQL